MSLAKGEEPVEVNRHMGAVEVADPDVDDAGLEPGAIVAGACDAFGQVRQGGRVQLKCHQLIQFPPSTL